MPINRKIVSAKPFLLLLVCISIAGCSGDAPTPNPGDREANLTAVANKLKSDPNASDDAKSMAGGVLQQIKNDKDARDFAEGK